MESFHSFPCAEFKTRNLGISVAVLQIALSKDLFSEFTRLSGKDIKSAMAKNLAFYGQALVNLPQPKGKGASMRGLSSELQEAKEAMASARSDVDRKYATWCAGILCLPPHLKEECGCLLRKFRCLGDSVQPIITYAGDFMSRDTKFYIYTENVKIATVDSFVDDSWWPHILPLTWHIRPTFLAPDFHSESPDWAYR